MEDFKGLGLHSVLENSLTHMQYTKPTPIQASAIPIALQGRDIMGSAQTGTGKTAAFAIPLIQTLLTNPDSAAIVLTPTRELAKQIMDIMHQLLGRKSNINTAFIIGGDSMKKQLQQLQKRPRLIVGTPGRVNDHLNRRSMDLRKTNFLVLDETDRMLDMGFSIQLDEIFKYMPEKRQTLMFSATLPPNIVKLSAKYLINPERVSVGSTINPAANIKQEILRVENEKKYFELSRELNEREGSVVIFVKTKHGTEKLAKKLNRDGFKADFINGDLKQNRRDRVIQKFRNKNFRVLVATDVASRGLDIPHIKHVINYDLPQVPEDYIHRIGRTARAGAEGSSLCLISSADNKLWRAIQSLMNPGQKPEKVSDGKPSKYRNRGKSGGGNKWKGKPRSGGNGGNDNNNGGFRNRRRKPGASNNSNGNGNNEGGFKGRPRKFAGADKKKATAA